MRKGKKRQEGDQLLRLLSWSRDNKGQTKATPNGMEREDPVQFFLWSDSYTVENYIFLRNRKIQLLENHSLDFFSSLDR